MNTVFFERKSDEWETPQALFDGLNLEFNFNYDPCATKAISLDTFIIVIGLVFLGNMISESKN